MQHRLRYKAHDFELPPGEFFIGRSDECQLTLDDPLVSRKHAVLRSTPRGVIVADLGSRNGVLVNGRRLVAERYLEPGDTIQIGSQELAFDQVDEGLPGRSMNQTLGDISAREVRERLRTVGDDDPTTGVALAPVRASQPDARQGVARETPETTSGSVAGPLPAAPSPIESRLAALAGVADKAIALRRADDVERILAPLFTQYLAELRGGRPQAPALLAELSGYALKLAHLDGDARWVEYVFDVHAASRRLMPASTVDDLHGLLRKVRGFNVRNIRDYLQVIRAKGATMSPNERFIVMRIEGLEAVATSG